MLLPRPRERLSVITLKDLHVELARVAMRDQARPWQPDPPLPQTRRTDSQKRRLQQHEDLLMGYAGTIIWAFNLLNNGCSRSQARGAFNELARMERRMRRMGIPPPDVLERVEQYWYENDVHARAEWLLEISNAMFPQRRWSFFFIGW